MWDAMLQLHLEVILYGYYTFDELPERKYEQFLWTKKVFWCCQSGQLLRPGMVFYQGFLRLHCAIYIKN
jgi:hypothetical protein